jgi:hypothetical protein
MGPEIGRQGARKVDGRVAGEEGNRDADSWCGPRCWPPRETCAFAGLTDSRPGLRPPRIQGSAELKRPIELHTNRVPVSVPNRVPVSVPPPILIASPFPSQYESRPRFRPRNWLDLGLRAQTPVSDHGGRLAFDKTQDDLAATAHDTIRGSHATPAKLFPLATCKHLPLVNDLSNEGGAPSPGVPGKHDLSAWSVSFT